MSVDAAVVLIRVFRSKGRTRAAVALRASHALSRLGQRCSVAVVHSQSRRVAVARAAAAAARVVRVSSPRKAGILRSERGGRCFVVARSPGRRCGQGIMG
jgi:hypothetical protein